MHNDMVRLGSTKERCNERSHEDEKAVEEDRISRLPDDVIHTVLSLISLREAIRTCVLSSRWRSMWTSLTSLSFSSQGFFPKFVYEVLYRRNNELQLSSLKLVLPAEVSRKSVKRTLHYASSHNIQQLTIIANHSETSNHIGCALSSFKATFPGLTRLHLDYIILSDDEFSGLFSKCPNLKHLSLRRCEVIERGGRNVLNICHPRLSNLTLEDTSQWLEPINVVAPQLKNLTILDGCCYEKKQYFISALGLTSLVVKGNYPLQLNATHGFPCLEKVDLCFYRPYLRSGAGHELICLLQQLHNVKFLTLNLEILGVLSSSMTPISHQPSPPFAKLNILKFKTSYPATVCMVVQPHENVNTSTLQDSLPSAIVEMISPEEIRGMRNIVSARQVIAELQVLLHKCKVVGYTRKSKTNSPRWGFGKMEIYTRKLDDACVTMLQRLEELLTKLPVSNSLAVQPIYSSVREEADVITKNIFECTDIQYNNNNKPHFFNV